MRGRGNGFVKLAPWLSPLALLGVWEGSSRYDGWDARIVPSPEEMAASLVRLIRSGELFRTKGASAVFTPPQVSAFARFEEEVLNGLLDPEAGTGALRQVSRVHLITK